VPNFEVTCALAEAARQSGRKYHTGVVQSKDSFYGQHEPARMPVAAELQYKWQAWKKGGALASEMECAALFCVSACLHVRAAAVLACVWNQERAAAGLDNPESLDTAAAINTAVDAMKTIIVSDKKTRK
jgi:uridine phosphorylase